MGARCSGNTLEMFFLSISIRSSRWAVFNLLIVLAEWVFGDCGRFALIVDFGLFRVNLPLKWAVWRRSRLRRVGASEVSRLGEIVVFSVAWPIGAS